MCSASQKSSAVQNGATRPAISTPVGRSAGILSLANASCYTGMKQLRMRRIMRPLGDHWEFFMRFGTSDSIHSVPATQGA